MIEQWDEPSAAAVIGILVMTALVMSVLAVLVYRDVERRTNDGAKVAVALVLFWPLGLYWWHRARTTPPRSD